MARGRTHIKCDFISMMSRSVGVLLTALCTFAAPESAKQGDIHPIHTDQLELGIQPVGQDAGACCRPDGTCSGDVSFEACTLSGSESRFFPGVPCQTRICRACPGSGPCEVAHGSPGCDEAECCAAVCLRNSECCESRWSCSCITKAERACEDCNGNGILDGIDIYRGTSRDCNFNDRPDECEIHFSTPVGGPYFCIRGCDSDCNGNGRPDQCDPDCDFNRRPDVCDIVATSQAPGGPFFCTTEDCDPDCNGNGKPDRCDRPDCDFDGMPDACEIDATSQAPGGPFYCAQDCDRDCNGNGRPDSCDSPDCNLNDKPDVCEIAVTSPAPGGPFFCTQDCDRDCNVTGRPDSCEINNSFLIDPDDCDDNNILDACEILDRPVLDANRNMVLDGCETDCNANGIFDFRDLVADSSRDCQRNGKLDVCEIVSSSQAPGGPYFCQQNCDPDCNGNGRPDECDLPDCNSNDKPDVCEIAMTSPASGGPFFCTQDCDRDCNVTGIPDSCEINNSFPIDPDDCDDNNILDACEILDRPVFDANGNMVLDGCETDCNANGIFDFRDLVADSSRDCQRNGKLDVCEIVSSSQAPGGPFFCQQNCDPDCNGNGRPDECDLPDCNSNDKPDVCEIAVTSPAPGGPFFCTQDCDRDCNGNGRPDECDLPDCNSNDKPDVCEIASTNQSPGGPFFCTQNCDPDCDENGIPDRCDPDCDVDGRVDDCVVPLDCNKNGHRDRADIVQGRSPDCNRNGVPDECEIDVMGGSSGGPYFCTTQCAEDCNLNGVPDDCDRANAANMPGFRDCNGNNFFDAADIASGRSQDCQPNEIPDECEADHNGNGMPDSCDIRDRGGRDENFNGILDEAECLTTFGDLDGDCDVDDDDMIGFLDCFGESGPPTGCGCADFDANDHVDLNDFGSFHAVFLPGIRTNDCTPRLRDACVDSWSTGEQAQSLGVTWYDFGVHGPIPADFFGPGSNPFRTRVALVGRSVDWAGRSGDMDTQVQHGMVEFDPSGQASTLANVVTLGLVAPEPVLVAFDKGTRTEPWLLSVNLSRHYPGDGRIVATLDKPEGNCGSFDAMVKVQPLFVFVRLQDVLDGLLPDCMATRVLDTGNPGPGRPPLAPIELVFTGQPFVRSASAEVVAEMGVPACAQGNFVAGVRETGGTTAAKRGCDQEPNCFDHTTKGEAHHFCPPKCTSPGNLGFGGGPAPVRLVGNGPMPDFPGNAFGPSCAAGRGGDDRPSLPFLPVTAWGADGTLAMKLYQSTGMCMAPEVLLCRDSEDGCCGGCGDCEKCVDGACMDECQEPCKTCRNGECEPAAIVAITSASNTFPCPCEEVSFTAIGGPQPGRMTWTASGAKPASGTGLSFRTRFVLPGTQEVTAKWTCDEGGSAEDTRTIVVEEGTILFSSDETPGENQPWKQPDRIAPDGHLRFLVDDGHRSITLEYDCIPPPAPNCRLTARALCTIPVEPSEGELEGGRFTFTPQATMGNRPIESERAIAPVSCTIQILADGNVIQEEEIYQDLVDRMRQEYVDAALFPPCVSDVCFLTNQVGLIDNAPPRDDVDTAASEAIGGPVRTNACRNWPMPNYRDPVSGKGIIWDQGFVNLFDRLSADMGETVCLHSGHRSPSHNRKFDGVVNSDHQWGRAADLSYPCPPPGNLPCPLTNTPEHAKFHSRLYVYALDATTNGQVILELGTSPRLPIRWRPPPAIYTFSPGSVGTNNAWSIVVGDSDLDTLPDRVTEVSHPNIPCGATIRWNGGAAGPSPTFRGCPSGDSGFIAPGKPLLLNYQGLHSLGERFGGASHVHVESN